MQWTLTYPAASVVSISTGLGTVASNASKTITCVSGSGVYSCLVSGLSAAIISNGAVVVVNLTIAAGAISVPIGITNATAASAQGKAIPLSVSGGTVTGGGAAPSLSSLSCTPSTITISGSTTCTVTLSGATSGTTSVALSSSNGLLPVAASVTVPAGRTSATFTATTTGTIPSDQSATLTATLSGVSKTGAVSLLAPVSLSSLTCNPTSLLAGLISTCTVTLTKAAPSGGTTVSLSSNSLLLPVATSVTVPATATSTTFTVVAALNLLDQSATLTATLGGVSKIFTLSLGASVSLSSLTCNPTSLGSGIATTCTVTLTKAAPSGGTPVSLSSNNALLPVATSVTVPANATSATFTATAGSIPSDQSATLTATLGGVSKTAAISLAASVSLSSLTCNPTSLGSGIATTCTVTLTKAAPSGGTPVSLSSNNALLPVAASVTVPANATSATFTATAGSIPSDQSATLTATRSGVSKTAAVSLVAPVLVSAVSCTPATLAPSASATCTVTLTKNALSGGASVSLSSTNTLLSVPASVTVAAGSNTASFTLHAGAFTANQSGSISASYNSSTRSFTVSLAASLTVTSLVCNPAGLMSGATSACTVTLSQPPAINTAVALSSNSPLITVPASVTISSGTTTAKFNATIGAITADTSGIITAALNSTAQKTTLTLWSIPVLTSLACSPTKITLGSTGACTVTLSKSAGTILVNLSTNLPAIALPASVTVQPGASTGSFTVTALATSSWVTVTATFNGVSKSGLITVKAAPTNSKSSSQASLRSLSCGPHTLARGSHTLCRVLLDGVTDSTTADLQFSSSSQAIQLPVMVTTQPGQSSLEFQVDSAVSGTDRAAVIAAQLGSDSVRETLNIDPRHHLATPGRQLAKFGTAIRFSVSGSDSSDKLFASALPAGASFEPASGVFNWTPTALQEGTYQVAFTAIDSTGDVATAQVTLDVDSGSPVIDRIVNAASRSQEKACSPGAIASVEGRWLAGDPATSDPSGNSLQLAGSTLKVNGVAVPLLYASSTRVDFLCPNSVPGSPLQIIVETPNAATQPVFTTAGDLAPGIFSVDGSGSGQAMAFQADSSHLAMVRNYRYLSQPAQPDDALVIYATGIDGAASISVSIGGTEVTPDSISLDTGLIGLSKLLVRVPQDTPSGVSVSLSLTGRLLNGSAVGSNQLFIAIEEPYRR